MDPSDTPEDKLKSRKLVLARGLLVITSIAIAMLIGEVGLRLHLGAWPFQRDQGELSYLTEKDVNLKWRFSSRGGRNSLGLRNREIAPKQEDVFRILFLGDSLVWSGDTSSGKLYTEVIEENLNEASRGNRKIEVINAGVPGYTTYQEMEFLKAYGFDMQPDLVVLGFVFNDVYYKYLHWPLEERVFGPSPEVHLHRFDVNSFPGMLFSRSYLAHFTVNALQTLLQESGDSPYYTFERMEDFYLAWKSYGWTDTERLIGQLQQQLSDRDIRLIIVIFPISDQVEDEILNRDREYVLYPQSRITEICETYNIPYVDLIDALHQGGGRALFADYLHLKGEGNDIVAAELTGFLSDSLPDVLE